MADNWTFYLDETVRVPFCYVWRMVNNPSKGYVQIGNTRTYFGADEPYKSSSEVFKAILNASKK